jgi:hypothetical protein
MDNETLCAFRLASSAFEAVQLIYVFLHVLSMNSSHIVCSSVNL